MKVINEWHYKKINLRKIPTKRMQSKGYYQALHSLLHFFLPFLVLGP